MLYNHIPLRSFKLEKSKVNLDITSFGGIALLRKTLHDLGLIAEMKKIFCLKSRGYSDVVCLEALILLLASGGSSLSDWEYFIADPGVRKLFGHSLSVDTLERYLPRLSVQLESPGEVSDGQAGFSLLLEKIHSFFLLKAYKLAGSPRTLHIDLDASVFSTSKSEALYSYKMEKAYQPFIVYCPEIGMVVSHEFRDGNISPKVGFERMLSRIKKLFPSSKFIIRSDSAGYQLKLMQQCCEDKYPFLITSQKSELMKELIQKTPQSHWRPLILDGINTGEEYSELPYCFTSHNQIVTKELRLLSRKIRFIAVRRKKNQLELFESEDKDDYTTGVIATNINQNSIEKIIKRHRQRCGTVEFAFAELKNGVNLKKLPSNNFNANAAFFSIGVLTHNLLKFIQRNILPEKLRKVEIKTLRYRFIRSVALIKYRARQFVIRCCQEHPLFNIYEYALKKLEKIAYPT